MQIWSATACGGSQVGSDINQNSSQNNWQGMNANGGAAFIGSGSIGGSAIARYQYSGTPLTPGHLYSWRAKAIDPGSSQTFGSYSACQDFTIGSTEVQIQNNTVIQNGTVIQ